MSRHLRLVAVLVLATVAVGCTSAGSGSTSSEPGSGSSATSAPPPTAADKAGAPGDPATLTLAVASSPGRPRWKVGERFAEEVARVTGGEVEVQLVSDDATWDHFRDGSVDLMLVPSRSLDVLGVTTFDALSLPFLVADDDQADRVAAADVVDEMMGGLSAIDATGLLFAPLYAYHLALAGDLPLRSLAQLQTGMRVFAEGERTDQIYEAIGAAPVWLNDDAWAAAVDSGDVLAREFPVHLLGVGPLPAAMATNLTLQYDFEVLAARNDVLDRLSGGQRAGLEEAAAAAQQRSIDERVREADAFRDACLSGAHLTAAPTALWAELGRATDQLVLEALQDPATRAIYDKVKRAAGARTLRWPDECRNGVSAPYEPPAPPDVRPPIGTYRVAGRSAGEMLASGVSEGTAIGNVVEYWDVEITPDQVELVFHWADGREPTTCPSELSVNAEGVLAMSSDTCGLGGRFTWSRTDDGIRLELMPTDWVQALLDDLDIAGLGLYDLVSVS